jgi:hypothetical protein
LTQRIRDEKNNKHHPSARKNKRVGGWRHQLCFSPSRLAPSTYRFASLLLGWTLQKHKKEMPSKICGQFFQADCKQFSSTESLA